jgi:hypothetical protein
MIMRDTFLIRMFTDNEKNHRHLMMLEDTEAGYRAKIILLKDDGYPVPQIRKMTNHHDHTKRKWIHSIDSTNKDLMALYQKSTITNNTNLLITYRNK